MKGVNKAQNPSRANGSLGLGSQNQCNMKFGAGIHSRFCFYKKNPRMWPNPQRHVRNGQRKGHRGTTATDYVRPCAK